MGNQSCNFYNRSVRSRSQDNGSDIYLTQNEGKSVVA